MLAHRATLQAMLDAAKIDPAILKTLNEVELRELVAKLIERGEQDQQRSAQEIDWRDAKIDKLTFELAQLKRARYGVKSEQLDAEQRALFEEATDADIAALEVELDDLRASFDMPPVQHERPHRKALPAHLPRRDVHHEPESTSCACGCELKRVGEDVSEKLDYTPGVFTVERHIRGK